MTDHAWCWGVDVSVNCLDFGFVHRDGAWSWNPVPVKSKGLQAARLVVIEAAAFGFARVMAGHCPPLAVYVELPTGRFPKPILTMAAGAAATGIYNAMCDAYNHPVSVHIVPPADWRKVALGKGNASKADAVAWAAGFGHEHERDDPAEALAIATACARDFKCGSGPVRSDPTLHEAA